MRPDSTRFLSRQVFYGTVLVLSLLSPPRLQSQDVSRRSLEHKDYDVWNTISSVALSNDGNWAMYQIQSGAIDGEATLHVQHPESGREYVVPRGTDAKFTYSNRFAVYRITPEKSQLKKLKKEEKPEDELPKSSLQVVDLESGDLFSLKNVRSFKTPEENGSWVACKLEMPNEPDELEAEKPSEREVYKVTFEGLRRPPKELKLKSRSLLARERGESNLKPEELSPTPSEPERAPQSTQATSSKAKASEVDEDEEEEDKQPGTPLVLIHLETGIRRTYPYVDSYRFSKNGKLLAFATSVKPSEKKESDGGNPARESTNGENGRPVDGLHVLDLESLNLQTVAHGEGEYKNLAVKEDGSGVAFITNKDDYEAETPSWSLYQWKSGAKEARSIAVEGGEGICDGWWVSPNSEQRFSQDGRRLFFEIAPLPESVLEERKAKEEGRDVEEDDDSEKAKLDVWHWQDPQLQPQQLLEAEIERERDYRAVYDLRSRKIAQLATPQMPNVEIDYRSPSNVAIANTNMRYRKTLSWDVPGLRDAYLVDLTTGEHEMVREAVKWDVRLSPAGKYITWFDAEEKAWFALSAKKIAGEPIQISKGVGLALHDELDDRPTLPSAYGSPGWLTKDRAMFVYDRYDIWQLDPSGAKDPICVTAGFGRENSIRFRYLKLDPEARSIDPDKPMVLSAFNRKTKASGFYVLDPITDEGAIKKAGNVGEGEDKDNPTHSSLRRLIMLDERLSGLQKAKESDRVLFTRSTFRNCPDLWSSDMNFHEIYRVSDMNPQQEEYSWGNGELVHWKSTEGEQLDGILLKPDGFDASKKYPMLVYFYERNSDNLHRYYTPAAGRSVICHSFYVSRGYLVFIPDIPYRTGEPGPSAASSVIPGVEHLIEQGFVDPKRIGMQGHSWGGYQTAYLVTKTDLFACAEAGAPVSNMTSAYGGIRWGSGLSRMFQYERTQSRIGENLWTAREKYIDNSPLFFADRINTPLLILHNDQDGAVPWYQGIELFVALRRLEKPAWMLNYNGDPHWVMGEYNRRDFATRMQQFFDHYLLDAPEPQWMAVGVSAVDKGKDFGLELLEPKEAEPKRE